MRRSLLLSVVVLMSGCSQAPAPATADAGPNAVQARKEMSDLLTKADAIAAANSTPPAPALEPALQQPVAAAGLAGAPADVHPATPAKPKADVMHDQAAAAFGDRLASLRRTAEAARLKKDRYSQTCQGKVAAQPDCQLLTTEVAEASKTIERELGDIQEAAQRARVDSGAMHDLLAKYGF